MQTKHSMDLSIIIAHYLPGSNHPCREAVARTFETLDKQAHDLKVELIVCDDGSADLLSIQPSDHKIKLGDGRICYDFLSEQATEICSSRLGVQTGLISHWLYLPRTKNISSKARLLNTAVALAQAEQLLFFDDDNYLIQADSLKTFLHELKTYQLLFGQIVDSNNHARPYSSHRVQGSTFGVRKTLLQQVGGFGEWTEKVSSGIDSDIWFKFYQVLKAARPYQAAWTSSIQSVDGCSKRWKPFVGFLMRHRAVRKEFYAVHGCKNYRSVRHNPSREKQGWIKQI